MKTREAASRARKNVRDRTWEGHPSRAPNPGAKSSAKPSAKPGAQSAASETEGATIQQAFVNDKLEISHPDSFRVMTTDELRQAYGMDYASMWGIRDEENHAILTIIWKEAPEALQKLVSSKSLVKRVEGKLKKAFRKQGYRVGGHFVREIADQQAPGFGYSYEVQGVSQACEVIVLRSGGCSFTLYYYTRSELEQANRSLYEGMLSSLRFA